MKKEQTLTPFKIGVFLLAYLFISSQGIAQCPSTCPADPIIVTVPVQIGDASTATFVDAGFLLGEKLELSGGGANSISETCVTVSASTSFTITWTLTTVNASQDLFAYSINNGPNIVLPGTSGSQSFTLNSNDEFCLTSVNQAVATVQFLQSNGQGLSGQLATTNWSNNTGVPNVQFTAVNCSLSPDLILTCADIGTNIHSVSFDGVTTCNLQITVEDNIAPEFTGTLPPTTMLVSCDAVGSLTTPTLTATDNCGAITPTLDVVPTQGSDPTLPDFYVYEITRTWTADDGNGNTTDFVQVISVADNQPPTFTSTPPTTMTATANSGSCDVTIPSLSVIATDECASANLTISYSIDGGASILGSDASSENFSPGSHIIVFTVEQPVSGLIAVHTVNLEVANPAGAAAITITTDNLTDVVCANASTGAIAITASGGSGVFTYAWTGPNSFSSAMSNISGLEAGTYNLVVNDGVNCMQSLTTVISETTSPIVLLGGFPTNTDDIVCNGLNTGTASVVGLVSGGTAPYTYVWKNGAATLPQATPNVTGLAAGTNYSVIITDANGCSSTFPFTIGSQPTLTSNILPGVTDVTCKDGMDGAITVFATGGTSPYTYTYQGTTGGATTQSSANIIGLAADIYTITITDANGCSITLPDTGDPDIEVEEPLTALSIGTPVVTDVNCYLFSTGEISVSASGGTPPYTYELQNSLQQGLFSNTTGSFAGLGAVTYYVKVTDANNCSISTTSISISQPNAISINFSETDVSCNSGSDGSITATVSGGTNTFTAYEWTNGTGVIASGPSVLSINGLSKGIYGLKVTDSNGCTSTNTVPIDEPSALSFSHTSTNVTCMGAMDGKINVLIPTNAGTSPYTVTVSGGGVNKSQTTSSNSFLFEDLPPFTSYTISVVDDNGCAAIPQMQPIAEATDELVVTSTSTNTVGCNSDDGTITLTIVEAGAGISTYSWSDNGPATQNRTDLEPGTYMVTVTDVNGCTNELTEIISVGDSGFYLDLVSTEITCNGADNGVLTLTVNGNASVNVTDIRWERDGVLYQTSDASMMVVTSNNLIPEDYEVFVEATITPLIGLPFTCTLSASATLTNPLVVNATTTSTDVNCKGESTGTATATGSGGSMTGYMYEWSDGQMTQTATNLAAGDYTVTVTDSKGCEGTEIVTIDEPTDALTSTITVTQMNNCDIQNSNASIFISSSGGTGVHTYSWSDIGLFSSTRTNLQPGIYTVTITDANGCTSTETGTIETPSGLLSADILSIDIKNICSGNDGSLTVTPSGGNAPYTYQWNDASGQTDSTATGLSPFTYSVTVTDKFGCTTIASSTVSQPNPLLSASITPTPVTCGAGTGAATVSAVGGTGSYTYQWDANAGGQTTAMVSGLVSSVAGIDYFVTVTDGAGCETVAMTTITQAANVPELTFNPVSINCGSTENLTVNVVNGSPAPYSYIWNASALNSNTISISIAGNYSVTVTDNNGCSNVGTITVTETSTPSITPTVTPVGCNGSGTGEIALAVTGGSSPYSYFWSNGQNMSTISNLASGMYAVTVTDNVGCQVTMSGINVTTITTVSIGSSTIENTECNGDSNGSIVIAPSGGTSPFTYNWASSSGAMTATSNSITGLAAGTYSVTITDANNCSASQSFTVTEPAILAVTTSTDDVDCNGEASGNAYSTPTGGTPPYSYEWDQGHDGQSNLGLLAGTYTITVTDANGCVTSSIATVNEPDELIISSLSSTAVSCNGGTDGIISITVSGGTAFAGADPYTYDWNDDNTGVFNTEGNRTGLAAGNYSVTIQDANGCSVVGTVPLTEPTAVTVTTSSTNVLCNGGATGSATATGTDGTAPYTYAWSNSQTTPTATALVAGTYTVTATDDNGCTATSSVTITEPTVVTVTATSTNPLCLGDANGTATATGVGGTAPYIYVWSNAATTPTATALAVGTYTVTATDDNGCTATASVTITAPTPVSVTATSTDALCAGEANGTATPTGAGGTAPYTYDWGTGNDPTGLAAGTYTVTASDANGCTATASVTIADPTVALEANSTFNDISCNGETDGNATSTPSGGQSPYDWEWSTGSMSQSVFNLSAATYTVTVTDANGCTATEEVVIAEPTVISSTIGTITDVLCNGDATGGIAMTVTGGTGPYTYDWDNDGSGDFDDDKDLTNVGAGTYNVVVMDANGCTVTDVATVSATASTITVSTTGTAVICDGTGSATATATGGTAPLTYLWSNNATTATITGVGAGTYTVTVTDANLCTATDEFIITVPAGALLANISNFNDISCNGADDGNATSNPSGGQSPYDWEWSTGSLGQSIFNLSPATYTVTVTDANGCSSTEEVMIAEPATLVSTFSETNVACSGESTGAIDFDVTGGTSPYTYDWNNDGTGDFNDPQDLTGLSSGIYAVTVMDANGCTVSDLILVSQPSNPLSISTTSDNAACNGETADASVTAVNGTAPYTYAWSGGQSTAAVSLGAGTHTIVVTDANGCTAMDEVTITEPDAIAITIVSVTDNICFGDSLGIAEISVTGGVGTYTYDWGDVDAQTTATAVDLGAGTYIVTVTDATSCTATMVVPVVSPSEIIATATTTSLACSSETGADIDLTVSGGTSPYMYLWSNDSTTQDITDVDFGTYTVTITDDNNCTTTASTTIALSDVELPTIDSCLVDTILMSDAGACGAVYTYITPTFNDNCDGEMIPADSITAGLASGEEFPIGTTTVTYQYTDVAGNGPVMCSFTVTVLDAGAPYFDTSDPDTPNDGDLIVVDTVGGCAGIFSWTDPLPVDDCGTATIISTTYTSPVDLPVGTYIDSIIVEDAVGNRDTMAFSFQIRDPAATAPSASCTNNVIISVPAGQDVIEINPALLDNGSSGNCGPVTLSVSPSSFTCDQADGTTSHPITLIVTDMNGLVSTCNTSVILQENTPPVMMCKDVTVELDENGNAFVSTDTIDNGSYDECIGLDELTLDIQSFNASNVGTPTTVTLTGTDFNGNSASCTAQVTVAIPKPCLDIPDNYMVGTGINCVPVTVTNFTNVRSFQQSIYIDPAVAIFNGICYHNLPTAPNVSFSDDTLTISYFSTAASLINGDVIFELEIDVVGPLNTSSAITVGNDPTPQEMIVEYGGTLFTLSTPFCSDQDGSIDVVNSNLSATGNVRTWDHTGIMATLPVANVSILKVEDGAPVALGGTTDVDGNYSISVANLSGGIDLVMTPEKNVNWLNYDPFPIPTSGPTFQGVTSFDLFTIQQHIVTNAPLVSNYQLIAADANGDGTISTLDLVLLQDIIVGNSSSISTNQSWRFVPEPNTLATDPLPALPGVPSFTDAISFNSFTSNIADVNWIAVKIGNVVGPVVTSNFTGIEAEDRSADDMKLMIEDKHFKAGEIAEVAFLAKDFDFVASQFTFEFNESVLAYETMIPNALSNFTEGNLGLDHVKNGKIATVWYASNAKAIADDEVLFTLRFEVLEDVEKLSNVLSISNSLVKSEAYLLDGSTGAVSLGFTTPTVTETSIFELHQNRPNPFTEKTSISFTLAKAGFAKLTLFDISGKVLKIVEGDYDGGFHQVEILRNDLLASGVVYYRLESADNTATKKMIVLK